MADLTERLRARLAAERAAPETGHNAADRERSELIRLLRDAAAALEAAREDEARLDWLEGETHPGIRLHSGNFHSDEHVGLGTANTGRTLRQAIDAAREARNG